MTLARTGKDLVPPRAPGEVPPVVSSVDEAGEPVELRPTRQLGPTVEVCSDHGKRGVVKPIRWNPMEGSSNGPTQVCLRGNADFQNLYRTVPDGFDPNEWDRLRTNPTEEDLKQAAEKNQEQFEADLPARVAGVQRQRARRRLEEQPVDVIEAQIRDARARRLDARAKGGWKHDFKRWVRSMNVEGMRNSLQIMFYICDYATKPNMTCAPLLVAIRDGVKRLEVELKKEQEEAQAPASNAAEQAIDPRANGERRPGAGPRRLTPLEKEAIRRLLRQVTAANQATVKGNCLMAMQLLTGREALRSHFPWRLMTKHAMWMAFEHRRQLQGFDERVPDGDVVLNAAEGGAGSDDESSASALSDRQKNMRQSRSSSDAEDGKSEDECLEESAAMSPEMQSARTRTCDPAHERYLGEADAPAPPEEGREIGAIKDTV